MPSLKSLESTTEVIHSRRRLRRGKSTVQYSKRQDILQLGPLREATIESGRGESTGPLTRRDVVYSPM